MKIFISLGVLVFLGQISFASPPIGTICPADRSEVDSETIDMLPETGANNDACRQALSTPYQDAIDLYRVTCDRLGGTVAIDSEIEYTQGEGEVECYVDGTFACCTAAPSAAFW